jgi:serine protease Do
VPGPAKGLGDRHPDEGVLVTAVEPDSVADGAGLRKGMVILKADQKPVKSVEDLQQAVDAGTLDKGLLLQVWAPPGGVSYILLQAAAAR